MASYGPPPTDLTRRQTALRATAFELLLSQGEPVDPQRLATALGTGVGPAVADLDVLAAAGRIKRDAAGRVLGSLGLTVTPTNHEIGIGGVRRQTYCALDALGILGALAADGWIDSTNPITGEEFRLEFDAGLPRPGGPSPVLFVAGQASVASVIDQWCPLVNFFATAAAALGWAAGAGVEGGCMQLEEAAMFATALWLPLIGRAEPGHGPTAVTRRGTGNR